VRLAAVLVAVPAVLAVAVQIVARVELAIRLPHRLLRDQTEAQAQPKAVAAAAVQARLAPMLLEIPGAMAATVQHHPFLAAA
jgi:hypothetical protein